MERVGGIIIGAGVVGLAVAMEIAHRLSDVVIIERHESFGKETSSRNSEVIHAGIYYPTGSLKAQLCVTGSRLLYEFCNNHNISNLKTGKLIVAIENEDRATIASLYNQGRENGLVDLILVEGKKVKNYEPDLSVSNALFSPSTGILDTHALMKCLQTCAEEKGVLCAYGCHVKGIEKSPAGYIVEIQDADDKPLTLITDMLINSAGLSSDAVASMVGIDVDRAGYRIHYSKGEYFRINGKPPWFMKHLIYPPPGKASLGIHTVIDLQGQLKLGPNVFYVDEISYDVEPSHRQEFFRATKPFLRFLNELDLSPDMAGIRPKLQKPGDTFRDFIICEEAGRGFPGFINLIGIESPGLTACLAIARYVTNLL
jgi:L-2-hydroxyglutarate oxidase LhgO